MPIITGANNVKQVYKQAGEKGWVIPCFCTENLTTSEAVLSAAAEKAAELGYTIPVSIAITCRYAHRSQAMNYTHTRNWDTGIQLYQKDLEILARGDGDFKNVDLLLHLDHIQHDADGQLLEQDLSTFSSIMYDASTVDFETNIQKTAEFVRKNRDIIFIEGACDEIMDATGAVRNEITTPQRAERYFKQTGVDMIVANLGTEHRAASKNLTYAGEAARAVQAVVGSRIVLHGCSSVSNEQVKDLFTDGVCKVNIWTTLERDASPVLFEAMLQHAAAIVGEKKAAKLRDMGLLGMNSCSSGDADLAYFTTVYRQDIIFNEMKKMAKAYLDMWYK